MIVPDTVEGAIILSVVDFFLSLLFIWGIGKILLFFPYLNRLGDIDENKLRGGH